MTIKLYIFQSEFSSAAMSDTQPVKSMTEIELMKVPQLKSYLRDRGWKQVGTKKELQALVFAAEQVAAPKLPSDAEERRRK